jgi:acetyl-CoA carboxylase carboxyl transferase subunit beta
MLFKKRTYATIQLPKTKEPFVQTEADPITRGELIPEGDFHKCPNCGEIFYAEILKTTEGVCQKCGQHLRLGARERIAQITDAFDEFHMFMEETNPLDFPGYEKKLESNRQRSQEAEGVVTGLAEIDKQPCILAVMDSSFMMGSMGSVVGEKITLAVERAKEEALPLIIFCASGGARMQEGIYSLMQMAKISLAIEAYSKVGGLYISVLTDPTTGGVTASFAMQGDLIMAEPGALIGFAGRRVIEQTIRQTLPEGFQRAEFLLEKGFVDRIIPRNEMKETLSGILRLHGGIR